MTEEKIKKLIDPCVWLREGIDEVNFFYNLSEREYNPAALGRLKSSIETAIRKRDELSIQEREIVASAYLDYPISIRTGNFLDEIYGLLQSIEEKDGILEGESYNEYVQRRLFIGRKIAQEQHFIEAIQETERKMVGDLSKLIDKLLRKELK